MKTVEVFTTSQFPPVFDFLTKMMDLDAELAKSLNEVQPPSTTSVAPFSHLCGRADCPTSVDRAGNRWCWCREVDARDICG
jgi:hypothetical protein